MEALPDNYIRIRVATCTGIVKSFNVSRTCKVSRLGTAIRERMLPHIEEYDMHKLRLIFNFFCMDAGRTLEDHGVRNGDNILVLQEQRGGKPVIYLFSPSPVSNVRVQLSLVKAWGFSAIYPPTPIDLPSDDSFGEVISWTEAHTNPQPPISPPASPSTELVAFDPACPTILPGDSAVLPFDKVTGYIDDALLAMELHAEARTSFITLYWLPNLSKHMHIALRFLPQDQYEASAPLHITPRPEITTRVFMLFMGVQESDLGAWETAWVPAEEWSCIVGVDTAKAKDASLFRVLEWGGMEIQ
ncbi:hypothetical protein FRC11_003090 [Ceratobasidium sp. 423]|nr:hypothetical protein FRC11_003090 [Ceratobasidium sp. 423]